MNNQANGQRFDILGAIVPFCVWPCQRYVLVQHTECQVFILDSKQAMHVSECVNWTILHA